MNKVLLAIIITLSVSATGTAQEFQKSIGTARTAYGAGKLEEAHFALKQALQELDLEIGREVLKILPTQLNSLNAVTANDAVTTLQGIIGTTIQRNYGEIAADNAELTIMSNSPMVAALNTYLNTPILGGLMKDANTKILKVQGYKARLEKLSSSDANKTPYELQIPMGTALIMLKMTNCTEAQITAAANAVPLQQIAKLVE